MAPKEVLACVLSQLSSSKDLCSCLATCRAFRDALADSPVTVRVSPAQRHSLSDPGPSRHAMLALLTAWITNRSPSASAVDVSGLPLEDEQVGEILRGAARLARLDLEGCKKLTPAVTRVILRLARQSSAACSSGGGEAGGGEESEPSAERGAGAPPGEAAAAGAAARLQFVNLQRCFQLTGACLDDLLRLSELPGSCLEGAAVSHLTLSGGYCTRHGGRCEQLVGSTCRCGAGPSAGASSAQEAAAGGLLQSCGLPCSSPLSSRASSLHTLVLTNCTMGASALMALVQSCPSLEYLFLGGSTLQVPALHPSLPRAAVDAAAPQATAAAAEPGDGNAAAAAAAATAAVADAGAAGARAASPGDIAWVCHQLEQRLGLSLDLPPEAWLLAGTSPPVGTGSSGIQVLSEPAAAAARARGLVLASAALRLPRLQVLECTFFDATTLAWLEHALSSHHVQRQHQGLDCSGNSDALASQFTEQRRPQLWELSRPACVRAAVRELAKAQRQRGRCGGVLRSALRTAVNCSSQRGRSTALHVAAWAGCSRTVQSLLDLGASPSARDTTGQQPLFVACEGGHAAAAAAMLRGGACATVMTTSGESPLYIASLKGHRAIVTLLLRHLSGVPWHSPTLYGDSFTPLMAAAVANRLDVAALLLQEAGPYARALASATNRYGQNAFHIAARKGCTQMMQLLAAATA